MRGTVITKICIPIAAAVVLFVIGSKSQHILLGLSFGFLVDILWSLIENRRALQDIDRSIAPLRQAIDYPLKRADERREYIVNALSESDEIVFITHTATGWLTSYLDEFEERLRGGGKKTTLLILDPNSESFGEIMRSRKTWKFDPSKIKLPGKLPISSADLQALKQIDRKYGGQGDNWRRHFEEKYRKMAEVLTRNTSTRFKVVLLEDLPSVNFIFSKGRYMEEFYVVLKNTSDSKFDLLARIDVGAGKIFDLYRNEFRRICEKYGVRWQRSTRQRSRSGAVDRPGGP